MSMTASARQNWCKTGKQASAVYGHTLSMRSCLICTQLCPAEFFGPDMGVHVPGAWSELGAVKAMD
eukprot:1156319-Pelagomonas_calceolata.AAC.5